MTNDPKSTNPGQPYRRTSDQLVSMQLLGTVAAIAFGFVGFQWQLSGLVSSITAQLTENKVAQKSLQEDINELKETVKDLNRRIEMLSNKK